MMTQWLDCGEAEIRFRKDEEAFDEGDYISDSEIAEERVSLCLDRRSTMKFTKVSRRRS